MAPSTQDNTHQATSHGSRAWLAIFDDKYCLHLGLPQITCLEERAAREDRSGAMWVKSFCSIHTALCGGWNDLEARHFPTATGEGPTASFSECIEAVRLALIGGGAAIINGGLVTVDAAHADRFLQEHLLHRPLEQARRLASMILAWTIMGPPKAATISTGETA